MIPSGKFIKFASSIRQRFERKGRKRLYDDNGDLDLNTVLENYIEKRKIELENKKKQKINYSNGTYSLILDGKEISKVSINESFEFINDLKVTSEILDESSSTIKVTFKGKEINGK